jgi:hypothetical protein
MSLQERATEINREKPALIIDLQLYPTHEGGREGPIAPGFGCPCSKTKDLSIPMFTVFPQLGDQWMQPGETRQVGVVFLVKDEAWEVLGNADRLYLYDGKWIGEAQVIK